MKQHIRRFVAGSVTAIALLLLVAACGGKETVASKSAEAFREAQQKGIPVGGDSHGGHSAGGTTTDSAGDHATMTGMDHSTMTGMDHSTMPASGMAGMDHSKKQGQQPMAGMDHSKKQGQSMADMDHSNTQGQQPMAGMDHSKMQGQSMAGMDHSKKQGQSIAGMDHSKMQGQQPTAGMDHSQMQKGQQPMAGMDHSNMPGMQHGAGAAGSVVMNAPTTSGEMQRMRPADTLGPDDFDAPAPISVTEAAKARQSGSQGGHATSGASAPAMNHSEHGSAASTPRAAPASAAVYTCRMHPEVTSDKTGTCPKCGMTLVKKN